MQTFLPYPNFEDSARVLDWRRLGKQRVEAKQIYGILMLGKASHYHPAWAQWKGYEKALLLYGIIMCREWRGRGYTDNLMDFFLSQLKNHPEKITFPPWLGDSNFHLAHRVRLVQKDDEYYLNRLKNLSTPDNFNYEDFYYGAPYSKSKSRRFDSIDTSKFLSS
jgi:hypothetical protein